jgi:hypothetical protein
MPDLRPKKFLVSDPVATFGILREAEVGRVPARMLLPIRDSCVSCYQTFGVTREVVFELQSTLCERDGDDRFQGHCFFFLFA